MEHQHPLPLALKSKKNKRPRTRASELLASFLRDTPKDEVSVGEIVEALGERAFGATIFIFALANLLIAYIPGTSTILGFPILLLSMQMILGLPKPWLPKKLANMQLDRSALEKMVARTNHYLSKVEKLIAPRLQIFSDPVAERALGIFCLAVGIVLSLPIVFGNFLPALALALIGLGLIEKDGICISLGIAVGGASIAYAVAFYGVIWKFITWIF